MKLSLPKLKKAFRSFATPIRLVMFGFLAIILTGTVLLLMPFATNYPGSLSFTDALFTATSATCVTGLSVANLTTEFTVYGQIVVLLLSQIGGIGFMTVTSSVYILIRHRISLRKRLAMREDLSQEGFAGLKILTLNIVKFTFVIELAGAVLLSVAFSRYFSAGKAVWYGVFHSVMAFCNSGFDIISPENTSFVAYNSDPFILLVLAFLIILGGIGFMVIADVLSLRKKKRLRLHSKVVLSVTAVLLFLGTLGFLIAEYNNPLTIGNMNFGDKLLNSFFQSVTARTAGFASLDQNSMTGFSHSLTIALMFIGACPGSTGGGIKTTTLFVLIATVFATLRKKNKIVIDMHSIGRETLSKAATTLVLALSVAVLSLMGLEIACGNAFSGDVLLFEQVSAYATVGLSRGITMSLNNAATRILTLNMYIGRIGSFGFFMAFVAAEKIQPKVKYPESGIVL